MSGDSVDLAAPVRTGKEVRVDWCEFSVKKVGVDDVFAVLVELFGEEFRRAQFEVVRDDERKFDARGPFGVKVHADRIGQPDKWGWPQPWSAVRVPGSVCGIVGTAAVLEVVRRLGAMGTEGALKVSRLDLALDDFDRSVLPRKFAEACVAGSLDQEGSRLRPEVVTRVRPDNWEWSRRDGGCFWLGGRKSPRLLRVYDKRGESKGAIPSVRFELQCRDEYATKLGADLLAAQDQGDSLAGVWAAHVVGFVDLRVAKGHRSESAKRQRLGWWERLVGKSGPVTLAKADLSSYGQWVRECRRQFSGFLQVMLLAEGVGPEGLAAAIEDPEGARSVVRTVARCLGARSWELSGEQELRLRQAFEARAMARRLGKVAGPLGA